MWEVLAQRLALYEYKCRIRSWKRLVLLTQSPVNLEFSVLRQVRGDDDEVETLVYESITYCIANDMKEDVSSSVARWMQEFNLPPYYTCLSYVGVTGLLEFELSLE
ncbi:hypothetical protein DD237_001994 [Peronospora effusa]|uniref:Uncharacterized protein n=1 Tax=Peronospora effusa TaxID=542832 RepID=A0A3R7Y7F1_9STRA|nr:hypothetical protein DD237_001994 [Peronospora effusa]